MKNVDEQNNKQKKQSSPKRFQCPFGIVIDQREKRPYAFADIHADAKHSYAVVDVSCRSAHLPSGDYAIDGMVDRCAVERKSLDDLYSTLGQHRDRFVRELERLAAMEVAWVVVEAELGEILGSPPLRSELNPKTVVRSMQAWMVRYPRVHWVCCPGRDFAEVMTFRLLERFWAEDGKKRGLDVLRKSESQCRVCVGTGASMISMQAMRKDVEPCAVCNGTGIDAKKVKG